MDRYTRIVLTVIAAALVYLCIVMTAFPAVSAQQTAARPGEMTGPAPVVIVGWRTADNVAVTLPQPVAITAAQPLRVTGAVTTERSSATPDRVSIVGWERGATRERATVMLPLSETTPAIPVKTQPQ